MAQHEDGGGGDDENGRGCGVMMESMIKTIQGDKEEKTS